MVKAFKAISRGARPEATRWVDKVRGSYQPVLAQLVRGHGRKAHKVTRTERLAGTAGAE
jgi:hypothetical protein